MASTETSGAFKITRTHRLLWSEPWCPAQHGLIATRSPRGPRCGRRHAGRAAWADSCLALRASRRADGTPWSSVIHHDVPGGGSIRAVSRVRSLPHQRRNNQSPDSSGTRLIVPPVFGPSVRPRLHLGLTVFGHLSAGLSLDLSTPAVASMWRPLFAHRIHLGLTVFGQTTPDESPGSLGTTIEPSIT